MLLLLLLKSFNQSSNCYINCVWFLCKMQNNRCLYVYIQAKQSKNKMMLILCHFTNCHKTQAKNHVDRKCVLTQIQKCYLLMHILNKKANRRCDHHCWTNFNILCQIKEFCMSIINAVTWKLCNLSLSSRCLFNGIQ